MKEGEHESIRPNAFRLFFFAIVLCLTGLTTEQTTGSAAEISAKEFAFYFNIAALSRAPPAFVRWSSTISAAISGRHSTSQLAKVSASLDEVGKAANISVSIRDDGQLAESANFDIVFLGQEDADLRDTFALRDMHLQRRYEDMLDRILSMPTVESRGAGDFYEDHGINRYACIYVIGADDAGQIERAMLIVNPDLPSSTTNVCILQGILHVFGFRRPLPGSIFATPSALKSMNSENNLTDFDLRLIRTLYSARLKSGMTREDILSVVENMADTEQ